MAKDAIMKMPWEISARTIDAVFKAPGESPQRPKTRKRELSYDPNYPHVHGKGKSAKSRREWRIRQEKFEQQNGLCYWCGEPMTLERVHTTPLGRRKDNPKFATFEHLLPKSKGGLKSVRHCVLAHGACNFKREKRKWPHDPVYGRKDAGERSPEQGAAPSLTKQVGRLPIFQRSDGQSEDK